MAYLQGFPWADRSKPSHSANLTKNAHGETDVSRRYLDSNRKSCVWTQGQDRDAWNDAEVTS